MPVADPELIGRQINDDIENSRGKVIIEEGTVVDAKIVTKLKRARKKEVPGRSICDACDRIPLSR